MSYGSIRFRGISPSRVWLPQRDRRLLALKHFAVGGFTSRRVLVSANKADFWEAKNKSDIHPDLEPQLRAVGLEFFGNLEAALGSLGF